MLLGTPSPWAGHLPAYFGMLLGPWSCQWTGSSLLSLHFPAGMGWRRHCGKMRSMIACGEPLV